MPRAFILDVDGTLVDSNYQHVVAWDRALRDHGVEVPLWRLHRHMGMGGDKLVAAVAGDEVEASVGDEIRASESRRYGELIEEVRPIPGARELIGDLADRGATTILASSAKEDEVSHYVEMLGARDLVAGWTSSADVEATKPEPDLVEAALAKADTKDAVMVGDATWDAKAAVRAGIAVIGVLTGGVGAAELESAGASEVYESAAELRGDLGALTAR